MIERLLRRTAGEVRVRVTGASLPRFLNACTQGGVRLRRMERVSWDRMDATLSLGDFRKLRSCMGRTGCRVHILERRGVPFVLAHLLPRTALLAGLAAFCVMAYLVGTRVWEIRTDISPSLSESAVMGRLTELGVDIGTPLRRAISATPDSTCSIIPSLWRVPSGKMPSTPPAFVTRRQARIASMSLWWRSTGIMCRCISNFPTTGAFASSIFPRKFTS